MDSTSLTTSPESLRLIPLACALGVPVPPSMLQPQDSRCPARKRHQCLVFQRVLRVVQAHCTWRWALSRSSPPTETRRRSFFRLPRPQKKKKLHSPQATGCALEPSEASNRSRRPSKVLPMLFARASCVRIHTAVRVAALESSQSCLCMSGTFLASTEKLLILTGGCWSGAPGPAGRLAPTKPSPEPVAGKRSDAAAVQRFLAQARCSPERHQWSRGA